MNRPARYIGALAAGLLLAAAVVACSGDAKLPTEPTSAAASCTPPYARSESWRYMRSDCEVRAPSLENNLLGDKAKLDAHIFTPRDGGDQRRPVVYLLSGYTDAGTLIASALTALDEPEDPATAPIYVVTHGVNRFGGSFYVNSPVTGNWEDAIVTDLVSFVDANYPTIPKAAARGISGASMGGFGALNLAMRHPDVFGAVYALSPGAFAPDGADARLAIPSAVEDVLAVQEEIAGLDRTAALDRLDDLRGNSQFEVAYGLAFAGDPDQPALFRFPFHRNGDQIERDEAIWAIWEAGFGDLATKVEQYGDNLRQLRGIGIDYGVNDEYKWIPDGSAYLADLLRDAGIDVVEAVHEGGHTDRQSQRLRQHMVPFMAEHLATA